MAARFRLTVNLNENEYKALSALAVGYQVSLAWMGRRAIGEFLDRYYEERRDTEGLLVPVNLSPKRRPADD